MKHPRLGVNIDHVATLRQARGEDYPSLVHAASLALESGADQITIHLREDRRHIQDYDLPAIKSVCDQYQRPLNLEMGASEEIAKLAIQIKPDWICLVPEKREERTTEGGLNLLGIEAFNKVEQTINFLKQGIEGLKVSLFVESDPTTLTACEKLKADAVEIHTGEFAHIFNRSDDFTPLLESFKAGYDQMRRAGISYHAGHGLDDKNIHPLLELGIFQEYNVGHWLICQSLFKGLGMTISEYKDIIQRYEVIA